MIQERWFESLPKLALKDWASLDGSEGRTNKFDHIAHGAIGIQNSKDKYSYHQVLEDKEL